MSEQFDPLIDLLVQNGVLDDEVEQRIELFCHLAPSHLFLELRHHRFRILRLGDEFVVGD